MSRKTILQPSGNSDERFLEGMELEFAYAKDRDQEDGLPNNIQNLIKYFDECINIQDAGSNNAITVNNFTKGKFATAVSLFRGRYGLKASHLREEKAHKIMQCNSTIFAPKENTQKSETLEAQNKKLPNQSSTNCGETESVSPPASVKDTILLYNKCMPNMAKESSSAEYTKYKDDGAAGGCRGLQREGIVRETQVSARCLAEFWEAKLNNPENTLQSVKTSIANEASKPRLECKALDDISPSKITNSKWEDGSENPMYFSSLTIILKSNRRRKQVENRTKIVAKPKNIESCKNNFKRTLSMIRSSFLVESLAPPRKIRRMQPYYLPEKILFHQKYLERCFCRWLKENSGIILDFSPVQSKTDIIEITARNHRGDILSNHEIDQMMAAAFKKSNATQTDLSNLMETFAHDSQTDDHLTVTKQNAIGKPNSTISEFDSKCTPAKRDSFSLHISEQGSNYAPPRLSMTPQSPGIESLNKSLIRKVNSPNSVRSAYTLTFMSPSSLYAESDPCDSGFRTPSKKDYSRSWSNTFSTDSLRKKLRDLSLKNRQQLAASNDDDALVPLENPISFSTPQKGNQVQQAFTTEPGAQLSNTVSPIPYQRSLNPLTTLTKNYPITTAEQSHTIRSVLSSEDLEERRRSHRFNRNNEESSSQFWIRAGEFVTAISIDHYEYIRLMMLNIIFGYKISQTSEVNLGIDDQIFSFKSNAAAPDEIVRKLPKSNNSSRYWFSTGDIVLHFRGKHMSTEGIHGFFNHIREGVKESSALSFGIDGHEFSHAGKKSLITNGLDYSHVESKERVPSQEFSGLRQQFDSAFFESNDLVDSQQNDAKNQPSSHNKLSLTVA